MTLRAAPGDITAAFNAQRMVLTVLHEYYDRGWRESRESIRLRNSSISESDLNFEEKKMGDLMHELLDVAMEVQHSETYENSCIWMRSKYDHCRAQWQCFSFKRPEAMLVVETDRLRNVLDEWKTKPTGKGADMYYTFTTEFLLNYVGAEDLIEWCKLQVVPIGKSSCGPAHTPGYCICGG